MTRKNVATTETEIEAPEATTTDTTEEQRLIEEQTQDRSSVAYLKAEKARIDAEYKAARDAEKAARDALRALKGTKSARSDVASVNATKALSARVAQRVKAGASRDDAISAELDLMRAAIVAVLDTPQSEEE